MYLVASHLKCSLIYSKVMLFVDCLIAAKFIDMIKNLMLYEGNFSCCDVSAFISFFLYHCFPLVVPGKLNLGLIVCLNFCNLGIVNNDCG